MTKEGELKLRILQQFGSKGMPSCGLTDAGRIGQDGNTQTIYVGGSTTNIAPDTPKWEMPVSVVHSLTPDRHSKSPRNMRGLRNKPK
jgi:hypothetical protein